MVYIWDKTFPLPKQNAEGATLLKTTWIGQRLIVMTVVNDPASAADQDRCHGAQPVT